MGKDRSIALGLKNATKFPIVDARPQPCKVEGNKRKQQTTNQ